MKIKKLEIKNLRGIPNLKIDLNAKSVVIYGANGSGKSGVVDAMDFLFTGRIARLFGEGTNGLTLKDHGPHIDYKDVKDVEVSAEVEIDSVKEIITIKRSMAKPTELIYDPLYEASLSPLLEILNRGQYSFTRREILKLITSTASTRAQEIQRVLKLGDIEDIRSVLVKADNESKKALKEAQSALKNAQANIILITGHKTYNADDILSYINSQRKLLNGSPHSTLSSKILKEGIQSIQLTPNALNHTTLKAQIQALSLDEVDKLGNSAINSHELLTQAIDVVKQDAEANWNSKRFVLTNTGLELLRDSGECPLCDYQWPDGYLQDYLQQRIEDQSKRQLEIATHTSPLKVVAEELKARIRRLAESVATIAESEAVKDNESLHKGLAFIKEWHSRVKVFQSSLESPIELYESSKQLLEQLRTNTVDADLNEFHKEVIARFPEATVEQTAWDSLTKLEERLIVLENCEHVLNKAELVFSRSTELLRIFTESRDKVLSDLYDVIKDRFEELYKDMHGEDEKDFKATFLPQEAGLSLEVDFYGRGMHPPHAMHSEGHQDSMGICLFLALAEHLNSEHVGLVVLDDVVMSVDSGHRRSFCAMLVKHFPTVQFIITTHDTTWANQLRSVGLVSRKQMLKFSNWDVTTGPLIDYEADMWSKIEADLLRDDVPAAAAKLRRGMEEFCRIMCDSLKALVPYSIEDANDFGTYYSSALGRYRELLGVAKRSANSWNKKDILLELDMKSEHLAKVVSDIQSEQWAVNKAVHYNEWAHLGKEDFEPIVKAFKQLYETVYLCENLECNSIVQIVYDKGNTVGVKCKCGQTNWNLVEKK